MSKLEVAEGDVLVQTVNDLQARFPGVAQDTIADHVRRAYAGMASAPVQDYVPLLAERQARLSLAAITKVAS